MIAGAEVDARTYLLPDAVTWGGIAFGILAAPALNPFEPWLSTERQSRARQGPPLRLFCCAGPTPGSGIAKVSASAMSSSLRRSGLGFRLRSYRSASRSRPALPW